MPLIEIEDVCKSYQLDEVRVDALCGVTLAIERGEFVALVSLALLPEHDPFSATRSNFQR